MGEAPAAENQQAVVVTIWWWLLTLLTLVVLDDLTFGPFFWLISRLAGGWWAVAAIYAVYLPVQLFLVDRGTRDEPGQVAGWFLARLQLQRRYSQVATNEMALRSRAVGVVSSAVLSLFIGGVLPPLILWRKGYPRTQVKRIAVLTSVIYATEFAVLHGLVPAAL